MELTVFFKFSIWCSVSCNINIRCTIIPKLQVYKRAVKVWDFSCDLTEFVCPLNTTVKRECNRFEWTLSVKLILRLPFVLKCPATFTLVFWMLGHLVVVRFLWGYHVTIYWTEFYFYIFIHTRAHTHTHTHTHIELGLLYE